MDAPTRKALADHLHLAISLLPRGVRHDLWRQCEPQHGRAEAAVVERLLSVIDFSYEVVAKPPRPPDSAAHLYCGPGERD